MQTTDHKNVNNETLISIQVVRQNQYMLTNSLRTKENKGKFQYLFLLLFNPNSWIHISL